MDLNIDNHFSKSRLCYSFHS